MSIRKASPPFGYCWGGQVILEMARAGANLDAVVTFHGILSTSNPAAKGYVNSRILVLHGESDPYAPLEQVEALRSEMTAAPGQTATPSSTPASSTRSHSPMPNRRTWKGSPSAPRPMPHRGRRSMLALLDEIYD